MMVRTYLKQHPEVREFWIQAKEAFVLCHADNFDDMNLHGDWKIKRVEEGPEGEPVTLHVA